MIGLYYHRFYQLQHTIQPKLIEEKFYVDLPETSFPILREVIQGNIRLNRLRNQTFFFTYLLRMRNNGVNVGI